MPELPEVESVGRALRANLTGRRLTGLKVDFAGVLDQPVATVRRDLLGKQLGGVHRHGKYLILNFDPVPGAGARSAKGRPAHLMLHLRMTGQVFILDGYVPDKHVHLTFDFEGLPVHYRDIRKFGRFTLVEDALRPACLDHVGPDMLEVRASDWLGRIAHRTAPIKALLLDQGIAAGLGNIYVDECLFTAGVHPLTRPCDLAEPDLRRVLREAKRVLRLSINHGGTTFLNFTDFYGKPGNFRRKLRVYGRSGQPCKKCGAGLELLRVAGRSSVFCPDCQPAVG